MPGTTSPDLERWIGVRDVEKPSAPARSPRSTIVDIATMSSAVGGSLAAPRSPITYARTAPWGTWAPTSTAYEWASSTSRYSSNDSQPQVMPSVSALPGMSSTPSISSISHSWRSGAAGANPTPQLPITTVVTPCHDDGVRNGSQLACPS